MIIGALKAKLGAEFSDALNKIKFVLSDGCPNAEATRQRLGQYLNTEFPLESNGAILSCSVHIANLA